jgi:hypothetical protein
MGHRNVQRLQERQSIAVRIDSPSFHTGFVEGMSGEYAGYPVQMPVAEQDIVSLIRNLCEIAQEGWLREEQLRHDAGIIAGWLLRQEV